MEGGGRRRRPQGQRKEIGIREDRAISASVGRGDRHRERGTILESPLSVAWAEVGSRRGEIRRKKKDRDGKTIALVGNFHKV